jgi:hypothetical protein
MARRQRLGGSEFLVNISKPTQVNQGFAKLQLDWTDADEHITTHHAETRSGR